VRSDPVDTSVGGIATATARLRSAAHRCDEMAWRRSDRVRSVEGGFNPTRVLAIGNTVARAMTVSRSAIDARVRIGIGVTAIWSETASFAIG
jgi:hypothetical protein